MLSILAPRGIAETIHSLALLVPREFQSIIFMILFTIYIYLLARLVTSLYCRADYLIAVTIRRLRRTPPSVQFWMGDFIELMPRRIIFVGFLLLLCSIAYALIEFVEKPKPDVWLFSAKTALAKLIVWVKS